MPAAKRKGKTVARELPEMELRDYIAVAAMVAWLNAAAFNQGAEDMMHRCGIKEASDKERFIARLSYSMADHMLAARKETLS